MATIDEIRTALGQLLDNIDGLSVATVERGSVPVPSALVLTPPLTYFGPGATAGATGRFDFELDVLLNVGTQLIDEAYRNLAELSSPTGDRSIFAATYAAGGQTLGGLVDDCVPMSFRPLGIDEYAAVGYLGGLVTFKIIARRG